MNRTLLLDKTSYELQTALNDACQAIDDATHSVPAWEEHIIQLLECLEFYAMANDQRHPDQFELMLERLKDRISARLKQGSW